MLKCLYKYNIYYVNYMKCVRFYALYEKYLIKILIYSDSIYSFGLRSNLYDKLNSRDPVMDFHQIFYFNRVSSKTVILLIWGLLDTLDAVMCFQNRYLIELNLCTWHHFLV